MLLKFPKDDKNFRWTRHIKNKMLFYSVSEQKLRSIIKNPDRKEEGIAPNTLAVMKNNHKKNRKEEIWVMYQRKNQRSKINPPVGGQKLGEFLMISAWRYPGVSKPGKAIPIPEEILNELLNKIDENSV